MISPRQRAVSVAILGAIIGFLAWNAPLKHGLTIGGDDGFELCKAQLLNRKPEFASLLHNDQPWLHTMVIAQGFALFGENAAVPRLLGLGLMLALVLGCWRLMPQLSLLERLLFLGVFFASREVPILSTSAMLDPAAIALAILAVTCSCSGEQPLSNPRSYGAGVLFAAAVATKLTALILIPAWAVFIWRRRQVTPLATTLPRIGFGFGAFTLFVIAISPTLSIESLWLSHWRVNGLIAARPELGHGFQIGDVFTEWTILIPVVLGVISLSKQSFTERSGSLFALIWLMTDFAVHLWHKPWWGYYAIHFYVPLAILAAQGGGWIIQSAWNGIWLPKEDPDDHEIKRGWHLHQSARSSLAAVVAAIILSSWCGIRLPSLFKELTDIHLRETDQDDPFVPTIRRYADQVKWLYCSDDSVAFQSGVLQPPELVLGTYKRVLNQELTKDIVFRTVQKYKPELLLLRRNGEVNDKRFGSFLETGGYSRIMWSGMSELWASSTLRVTEAARPEDLVRTLGL